MHVYSFLLCAFGLNSDSAAIIQLSFSHIFSFFKYCGFTFVFVPSYGEICLQYSLIFKKSNKSGAICLTAKRWTNFIRTLAMVDCGLDNGCISTMSSLRLLHNRRSTLQYFRLRRSQGKPPATFYADYFCINVLVIVLVFVLSCILRLKQLRQVEKVILLIRKPLVLQVRLYIQTDLNPLIYLSLLGSAEYFQGGGYGRIYSAVFSNLATPARFFAALFLPSNFTGFVFSVL